MNNRRKAEEGAGKLNAIISKLMNPNGNITVTLTDEEAALLIAWLQEADLVRRPS